MAENFASVRRYGVTFFKWQLIAGLTGAVCGGAGTLFHIAVEAAAGAREALPWMLYLLPLLGVVIIALYHLCGLDEHIGTNRVIDSVRTGQPIPLRMSALIFVGTALTHLGGGSAGREGAALQIGGSLSCAIGRLFHLDEKDMHLITLCGMSGLFSALFGTPVTATVFALGVVSVGVMYYSGLVPCLCSALVAYGISLACGVTPVRYTLLSAPALGVVPMLQVLALAALCALLSILFCQALHAGERWAERLLPNPFARIFAGGCVLVILTLLLGTRDYNGAGMQCIERAIGGAARPEAFALKLLFTVITIAAGYKGGEIVPTFFIGATFGCAVGGALGLDPGFAAAVGLVALFCGMVNCPIASMVLSVELFGGAALPYFAAACAVSFMLSGNYGLYSTQKIMYSKLRAELLDRYANH